MGSAMGKWTHRLSDINESTRTATCAACGAGAAIWRGKKRPGWRCRRGISDSYVRKLTASGKTKLPCHRLSGIEPTTRTATCALCGPGTPIQYRAARDIWVCAPHRSEVRGNWSWVRSREELVRAQNGRCAVCGTEARLVLDHNHDTGRQREALCHGCNVGLGFMRDDPEVLRKAAGYLERHQPVQTAPVDVFEMHLDTMFH